MRKRAVWGLIIIAAMARADAAALPPVVGAGETVTLREIEGTSTLVTVVLQEEAVEDKNLRVVEVFDDHFTLMSADNTPIAYTFGVVKEVRVQGGKVESKPFVMDDSRVLRAEYQKVVDRAYARTREIFEASPDDQMLRMNAAVLLAQNRQKDALAYLQELAASDDLLTALNATRCLYLVGELMPDKQLLARGLESGNRRVKAAATELSGLLGDRSNESYLSQMLQDRSADYAAAAARALARLGNRD